MHTYHHAVTCTMSGQQMMYSKGHEHMCPQLHKVLPEATVDMFRIVGPVDQVLAVKASWQICSALAMLAHG